MQGRRRNRGSDNNTDLARGKHAELKAQVRSIGLHCGSRGNPISLRIMLLTARSPSRDAGDEQCANLLHKMVKTWDQRRWSLRIVNEENTNFEISMMLQHSGSDNGVYMPVAGQSSKDEP